MQTLWSGLGNDIRYALRQLRRSPGFAATAILTLALGVGAVTAVFSVVDAVLLKPFAFPHPEQLVVMREMIPDLHNLLLPDNYKHYEYWKSNSKTLEDAAIFENDSASVSAAGPGGDDHPQMVGGLDLSPNFFSVLGIEPALGRSFLPSEAVPGRDHVVILSWSAWQQYFHGDPSAIGRTLRISGEPEVVVGVLPQAFSFPHMSEAPTDVPQKDVRPYEIFRPLVEAEGTPRYTDEGDYDFLVVGRLKPGATQAQAASELNSLQQAFMHAAHLSYQVLVRVEPMKQEVAGGVSTALWLLLAAVAAVLLIACVNLANLQLARGVVREREMAVRAALGATRDRLARSALMESLVLSVAGGALGIALSFAGVRLLIAAAPAAIPRLSQAHVSLLLLIAAAVLSIGTAVLFGLLPATRAMRVHPQAAMQSSPNRVANTREGQRTRHLLVAGQVAFTVVLLVVTGLLMRSFSQLLTQQRGFDAEHIALAEVDLANPQYADDQPQSAAVRRAFIGRALTVLSQLPGVDRASVTSAMPFTGDHRVQAIDRLNHPLPSQQQVIANERYVSSAYASTLKMPLLSGRDLNEADLANAGIGKDRPAGVLISEHTAREAWAGEDPIGSTFKVGPDLAMVVGVVADARVNNLKTTANMVYVPYTQRPPTNLFFLVRSSQTASSMASSVRRAIWSVDPQVTIPTIKSLDEQVNDSVATERFQTVLLATFGTTALLLALLGIYGVLAYSVSLRQQEFGIRIALGSGRGSLVRLVIRQAGTPVLGGTLIGLLIAIFAVRYIRSLLYETSAADPAVIAAAIGLLLGASLLAAWVPARRAAATDPMKALRTE